MFDPKNPEGKYSLNLAQAYGQICLQSLLQSAEKSVQENEGKFEIKNCFVKVALNAKGKWDPPLEKTENGLFNLGQDLKGILTFEFVLNPAVHKETERQIKKLQESGDAKQMKRAEEIRANQLLPAEVINTASVQKKLSTDSGTISFFNILLDRYQEGDDLNIQEMIINLTKEYSLWFSQAHEALYVCKQHEQAVKVIPYLMNAIQDSHLRFAMINQAFRADKDLSNLLLSDIRKAMGVEALYFSCFNPNGSYVLDLAKPVQREVAKSLVAINKRVCEKIVAKQIVDTSQNGN